MPLLDPTTRTYALLADKASSASALASSLAMVINSMAEVVLSLDNDQAGEFLNSRPREEMQQLFQDHLDLGTAVNTISLIVDRQLKAAGIPNRITEADVRPISVKLGDRRRTLSSSSEGFSVESLPPVEIQ